MYCVYHPGFSKMFRKITGGVIVSLYPMPIIDRITLFCPASFFSSTSNSCSPRGCPMLSGFSIRIALGTVASAKSSSESYPSVSSIPRMSAPDGPMCRCTNVSDGDKIGATSEFDSVTPEAGNGNEVV